MKSDNHRRWKSLAGGAVGGLAASFAMSQFHSLWNSAAKNQYGESGEDATVKTASAISENIFQHELTKPEKQWAGPAVHYAFGAVCGAVYGALAEAAPFSRAGFGVAYGSALWLGADQIAVPTLGLSSREPTPVSSTVQEWASHLVYGVVTDLTRRAVLKIF